MGPLKACSLCLTQCFVFFMLFRFATHCFWSHFPLWVNVQHRDDVTNHSLHLCADRLFSEAQRTTSRLCECTCRWWHKSLTQLKKTGALSSHTCAHTDPFLSGSCSAELAKHKEPAACAPVCMYICSCGGVSCRAAGEGTSVIFNH